MDIVSSCKDKLTYFRIKELKDILTQLGLSKQGKKQDLFDRLLAILSDEQVSGMWAKKNAVGKEEVAKLVDDTYRKMQVSGAPDLASKAQCVSDSSNLKVKEEIEVSYQMHKTRCPCGSSLHTDSVIKCADSRCNVWQHIDCVIVPEKPMEGVLPVPPEIFYCELCRLSRADPFWVTVAHPLYPVKLSIANISTDGTNPGQNVEKTFQLTRVERALLAKQECDVQAWCILLNDKVPFRMHWPQHADLQVNGVPVRATNRPGAQLLGANGRDDGPVITPCTRDGINKISLTGCDARVFCLGVRIVKRRTIQHILNLIPRESDGESFEDALARVRRCVGGGTATENADSDSDLEVVADSIPVNLRCPMSGSRMNVSGRFKPCAHMGCFDLEIFVEMNQRSRKWQCPICVKNYSLENIIIDPYFNRITSKMRNCGEDVTEIEVKPDGSWRVMAESDRRGLGDLGLWHFPDGTLCPLREGESKPKPQVFNHVKEECLSEGHNCLNLVIKNRNGFWQVDKTESMQENIENSGHNVIPMYSSATGSGRDCEDHSVNQDDAGNVDFFTNNAVDLDSFSLNVDPNYVFANENPSALLGDPEVIVLSDSEEENGLMISSGPVYKTNQIDTGGVAYSYNDNPSLSLFNTNAEIEVPLWSLPSGSQGGGSAFQLFSSEADISMNGYTLTAETGMGSDAIVIESTQHSDADIIDVIVDNPLGFGGDDPSLQIFLPTRPSDAEVLTELRHQPGVSNGIHKDWISLGPGGGASGGNGCLAGANVLASRQHLPSKEGTLDSLADTASLLLSMNDNRTAKPSREISNGPFSFPRQRRSVRPRLYLSVDSDSD